MREPKTLSQYPWVVVRLDCRLCQRRGCYRLARLAARYGPEVELEKLLAILASDCPWWRSEADKRKYDPSCAARFVDLDHNLPPQDLPSDMLAGPPVHRERLPAREDAPKPPRNTARNTVYRLPMLGDQPEALPIVIVCRRCNRRRVLWKTDLLAFYGDKPMGHLLKDLTAGCPRFGNTSIYELCQAHFETAPVAPR